MPITEFLAGPGRELLPQILPEYLGRQRWFGSKSRAIRSVSIAEVNVLKHADAALALLEVAYTEGDSETYQLPLAVASGAAAQADAATAAQAIVATLKTADGDVTLYDAVHSGRFRTELLRLTAESLPELETLTSRLSSAEQSNTSILYGDRYILKLYRRLQPGVNPDVEIPRFLTSVAHFHSIPAYVGHLQGADGSTLTFLQSFTPNRGDGWKWMSEQLADFYTAAANQPSPAPAGAPASFLQGVSADPELTGLAPASLEAAALLGRRTAELHLALATPTDETEFAAEAFTPTDLAADSTRIHAQMVSALDAMKQHLSQVPADLMDGAASLLGRRKQLLEHAHVLATASPYRFGRRIRIHGDYHLGQVLRTNDDDFAIVDFEGEPARALAERRRKQSPLRDVAGMMRSFSYVAFAALDRHRQQHPGNAAVMESWATAWERAASALFLAEYRKVIAVHPELLPQPEQAQALLLALLLEKALYELLYELNNRPSWLRIPLGGVLSLLREAA